MSYYNNKNTGGYSSGYSSRRIGYGSSYYDDYYDSGYGSYYGNSNKGSYYGGNSYYSNNNWSWGTFGYDSVIEDNDDLYIKAHESYFTPKDSEISKKLGRSVNTKNNRNSIKEFARFFYHKMIDDKNYFDEKYNDESSLSESEMEQFQSKKQYYEELWDKFIPGYTPLEQAMSLFNELQRQNPEQDDVSKMDINKTLNENKIEFNREIYTDPVINELLEMHELSKDNKVEIMNMISLFRNFGSEFKIKKEVEEKIIQNSDILSKKIMRDYSQLHMVDLYQRLLPGYDIKMLTKDLVVNVPVDRTEHKQKIIMLLDYSGSMHDNKKQKWVLAILIDRLRYAIKEEAEVFFSYFVHKPEDMHFHHIYDRKTAIEFFQQFSTEPNGGDTYIGKMIDSIREDIEDRKILGNLDIDLSQEKPEILIINDGQDSVKTDKFSYKTNAISLLDGANDELKQLCIDNNGKYVFISHDGNIDIS
jgi:uncharacterized protein with von Willebrand factor type A (vWA) domain